MALIFAVLMNFLTPHPAQAKCLYSPVPVKTNDVYSILRETLAKNPMSVMSSPFLSGVHVCHVLVMEPDPMGAVLISLDDFADDGKTIVQDAVLEVPKEAANESRAQCLWAKNKDPLEGPTAELEVKGLNGNLLLHLTPDEPGAPYIKATVNGKTFECFSK